MRASVAICHPQLLWKHFVIELRLKKIAIIVAKIVKSIHLRIDMRDKSALDERFALFRAVVISLREFNRFNSSRPLRLLRSEDTTLFCELS